MVRKRKNTKVSMSEMTKEKQLARAQELFPDTTVETLADVRRNTNLDNKRYIMYGIKFKKK